MSGTVIAVVNASFICLSILASAQDDPRLACGVMKYLASHKAETCFFNFWYDDVKSLCLVTLSALLDAVAIPVQSLLQCVRARARVMEILHVACK